LVSAEAAPAEGLALGSAEALAPPLHIPQDESPIDLDDFVPLTDEHWGKLEIYFFATCANQIRYHKRDPERPVPWIENFGNEHDIVARLGMLAPEAKNRGVRIEGPHYVRRGAWGHLLNIDYLLPIAEGQKRGRKRGGRSDPEPFSLANRVAFPDREMPRLFSYINGGSPDAGVGARASR
jgi:hypothetical protein